MAKILLADDDLFYRRLMGEELKGMGHEVVITPDGLMALSMLKYDIDSFDLMVIDVFMPVIDGITLLERLNNLSETTLETPVPAIVMTSDTSRRTELLARRAGATYFIVKPFSRIEFSELVSKALTARPYRYGRHGYMSMSVHKLNSDSRGKRDH